MAPKRIGRALACAESAGIMASRKGIAITVPRAPRRNVRRGRCFLVTIIRLAPWAGLKTCPYDCTQRAALVVTGAAASLMVVRI